ncbi:hypothetical protein PoB_004914200 [Plakobranchus ocellatus]|uniref:Uncharacterized protein n=1 Tax=Plakobranchus ocellatus TaxID=259542 RepID=A0AAV4BUF9_9GAST|nr:hypothetical protein PoB_004914200 [Plakobranchus ocellatus]
MPSSQMNQCPKQHRNKQGFRNLGNLINRLFDFDDYDFSAGKSCVASDLHDNYRTITQPPPGLSRPGEWI